MEGEEVDLVGMVEDVPVEEEVEGKEEDGLRVPSSERSCVPYLLLSQEKTCRAYNIQIVQQKVVPSMLHRTKCH